MKYKNPILEQLTSLGSIDGYAIYDPSYYGSYKNSLGGFTSKYKCRLNLYNFREDFEELVTQLGLV